MAFRKKTLQHRAFRVRRKIKAVAGERFRLCVFRSNLHIYAQIIDDSLGHTLVSASSLDSSLKEKFKHGGNIEVATAVGDLLAQRAKENNIDNIVFDRGAYIYHGRVKALAEAARQGGLSF